MTTNYSILLDGDKVARADSEDALRSWIAKYREDHTEDDPDAAHLQILERGSLAWLLGGKLLDRRDFF